MSEPGFIDTMEKLAGDAFPLTKLADGTGIILDLSGMQVLSLNDSATYVVEAIRQGERSVENLAHLVARAFEVPENAARLDIERLLLSLRSLIDG